MLSRMRAALRATAVLQFSDPSMEEDFVLQTAVTGLTMTRVHRVVDASIFWLAARELYRAFGEQWPGPTVVLVYRLACVFQLTAMLLTLVFPSLALKWHEPFKVCCQTGNYMTMITATWGLTALRSKYQLSHAINNMMCAINYLPGQVRVSTFAPVLLMQSLLWILVGAKSRMLNPVHAGPPLTTVWQWAQHIAFTLWTSCGLIIVIGTILEVRGRHLYLATRWRCSDVHWKPGSRAAMVVSLVNRVLRPLGCGIPQLCGPSKGGFCLSRKGLNEGNEADPGEGSSSGRAVKRRCCANNEGFEEGSEDFMEVESRTCSLKYPRACASAGGSPREQPKQEPDKVGPCFTTEAVQMEACQRLLDDRERLDKQRKDLAFRLELLETEVGRENLEAMAERARSTQLAQQVTSLSQQLAAQRCVATFLGANEKPLREELANLHKERNELAQNVQRLRGSVKRIASEKLEVLERLERAMHIINHLREQAFMERQTMWAGLLRSLNLQENPPTLQEAAPAVTRRLRDLGWPVNADLAAWLEGIVRKDEDRMRMQSASSLQLPTIPASDAANAADAPQAMEPLGGPMADSAPAAAAASAAAVDSDSPKGGFLSSGSIGASSSTAGISGERSSSTGLPHSGDSSRTTSGDSASLLDDKQTETASGLSPRDGGVAALPSPAAAAGVAAAPQGLPDSVLRRLPRSGQPRRAAPGPSFERTPCAVEAGLQDSGPIGLERTESELLADRYSSMGSEFLDRYGSMSSEDSVADSYMGHSLAGRSPLRDCGTCSGRAHMPGLNPLSSRMIGLTAGPAIAGPEWMHLFAAKCRQEERWGAVLADHLRLLQASLEQQSAQDLEALRGALGCADQGGALRGAPPCRSCETAALRLAQSEAEHAGLRGAVVAAMRHLIGQQKALRQSVANISGSLACGPQLSASCCGIAGCTGSSGCEEASAADRVLKLAEAEREFREQAAVQLFRLSKFPPQLEAGAACLEGMIGAVPTDTEIVAALTGGDTSEAEKHMGTWLATVVSWLQSMASSSDTESGAVEGTQGDAEAAAQRLQGALEVVVGVLVDRAFATQTAVVQYARSLARQAHALSIANQQLRDTRQTERRMLEVLMGNRQKLLAEIAALRCCAEASVCSHCSCPISSNSCASCSAA